MKDILIPYGLRAERLVHVREVESGLACECVCPACGEPLIARKGHKRQHHFAHHSDTTCEHALESTIHLLAKEVLAEHRAILLPAVSVELHNFKRTLHERQLFAFDSVDSEKRLGSFVPDLIARKGEHALLIEIRVAHKVDAQKRVKIRRAGVSAVEVDLSECLRDLNREEIKAEFVERTRHKHWIFNRKAEEARQAFLSQAVTKKVFRRGRSLLVSDCPLAVKNERGKSYARVREDCSPCVFLAGSTSGHIKCCGHLKV